MSEVAACLGREGGDCATGRRNQRNVASDQVHHQPGNFIIVPSEPMTFDSYVFAFDVAQLDEGRHRTPRHSAQTFRPTRR